MLITLAILFASCTKNTSQQKDTEVAIASMDSIRMSQIIRSLDLPPADFQMAIPGLEEPFIVAYYSQNEDSPADSDLYLVKQKKSNWQLHAHHRIENAMRSDQFELVYVNEKPFLYFENAIAGGTSNNAYLNFYLFDLINEKSYVLEMEGYFRDAKIEIDYSNIAQWKGDAAILAALQQQIEKSESIYHPNSSDFKDDAPDNYLKRFTSDNPTLAKQLAEAKRNQWISFSSFAYQDTNYFAPLHRNEADFGTIESKIENERFTVFALFKGPVIVYEKQTQTHFVAWQPSEHSEWIEWLEWTSPTALRLYYHKGLPANYLLDVDQKKIQVLN